MTTLRWARLYAGLTQAELAAAVGTRRATISALELGQTLPNVSLAIALARRLDVSVEELFAFDELR